MSRDTDLVGHAALVTLTIDALTKPIDRTDPVALGVRLEQMTTMLVTTLGQLEGVLDLMLQATGLDAATRDRYVAHRRDVHAIRQALTPQ